MEMITTRGVVASSLVVAAMGSPALALAEDSYQAEAGLSYSRVKIGGARQTSSAAEASYFFGKLPTQPKDYPLEQAQFVERIGSVSANFGRTSLDPGNTQGSRNGSLFGVNGEYRRPDTPMIASVGIESLYSGTQIDARLYQASIGAYVGKTTALTLDGSRIMTWKKTLSGGQPFSEFSDALTSVGLSGQHLARLSGGDHVAFSAGVSRETLVQELAAPEKNRSVFLKATYYPTTRVGLKLGVLFDRGDDSLVEGETFEAGAKMFLTPAFSLDLDFQRFNAKAGGNSGNFVTIRALVRF
jgi:hypothetical protein